MDLQKQALFFSKLAGCGTAFIRRGNIFCPGREIGDLSGSAWPGIGYLLE
jgi:hypothetical protein